MLDSVAFLDNCSDPDFEAASLKDQLGKEPQFIVAITFLVISSWGVLGDMYVCYSTQVGVVRL